MYKLPISLEAIGGKSKAESSKRDLCRMESAPRSPFVSTNCVGPAFPKDWNFFLLIAIKQTSIVCAIIQ